MAEGPVVSTPYGAVRGRYENGLAVFRGIPYAAPPFGPRRFRPPVPPEPWDGVRDAGAFGPTPPKPPYSEAFAKLLADPVVPGDDILNLNVWTPEPGPGARLPVMVWIHGGALTRGSSAVPVYDGRSFARDGLVFVSLNYRLGVEGYGLFPDAPANPGLRDQLAALEWVRDAIAGFGGDPDRVTVFGESAGAISIGALLASPYAQGLFRRAALQSGPPEVTERDKVRRLVRRMATRLKIPATAEAFAAVDRAALAEAQAEVGRRASPVLGGPAFGIVVDGDLVPRDPLEALLDGDAARDVDLLLGWTSEEYRLWLAPPASWNASTGWARSPWPARWPAAAAAPRSRAATGWPIPTRAPPTWWASWSPTICSESRCTAWRTPTPRPRTSTSSPGPPTSPASAPATPWSSASSSTPPTCPSPRSSPGPGPRRLSPTRCTRRGCGSPSRGILGGRCGTTRIRYGSSGREDPRSCTGPGIANSPCGRPSSPPRRSRPILPVRRRRRRKAGCGAVVGRAAASEAGRCAAGVTTEGPPSCLRPLVSALPSPSARHRWVPSAFICRRFAPPSRFRRAGAAGSPVLVGLRAWPRAV